MSLSMVVALLQAALMLLTAAQAPNVPQSLRDEATQVANQAISQATAALASPQPLPQTNTPNNFPNFSASPTSGAAPLTVTFSGIPNDGGTLGFGDGSLAAEGCAHCTAAYLTDTHTYTSPGTYTVTLASPNAADLCNGLSSPNCGQVGTAIITVTGSSVPQSFGSLTATPASGAAPLAVTFHMYGNVGNFATIDFGDGSSLRATDLINTHSCSGTGQGTTCWHSYLMPGIYTTTVKDASGSVLATTIVVVSLN